MKDILRYIFSEGLSVTLRLYGLVKSLRSQTWRRPVLAATSHAPARQRGATRLLATSQTLSRELGFSVERWNHAGIMPHPHSMPKLAKTLVTKREIVNSNSEKLIRVRLRALEIPPIKDGLVIGRDAAIGGEAMLRTLRLMTHEKFERIALKEEIIQEVIVRTSVLKKLGRERLIEFVLNRIKPIMSDTELLMLDIEVELVIEDTI